MTPTCTYAGCTFDTTGICVLGNDPDTCPNRNDAPTEDREIEDGVSEEAEAQGERTEQQENAADAAAEPPLQAPQSTRTPLPLARQLGFPDLEEIGTQSGYRMIGILGMPDAGKTAALVSLYLLAANDKMASFRFRNSASLFGFDEIAGGAKNWDDNGQMLEKITEHTELADPRRPGFLHLRLHSEKVGGPVDLVFPDLPGEWTDSLIDKSDHERLRFMRTAQALWILVDGSALADPERRQLVVGRTQRILSRVRQYFDPPPGMPIMLVVTRRDKLKETPSDPIARIRNEAAKRQIDLTVVEIASFPSGLGIAELLDASITLPDSAAVVDSIEPRSTASRQMLRFRSVG